MEETRITGPSEFIRILPALPNCYRTLLEKSIRPILLELQNMLHPVVLMLVLREGFLRQ